jgi:hypothetical protein
VAGDALLDSDQVTTLADSRGTETEMVHVVGGPGSASPPGATVRVYNLDSDAPAVETAVRDDGSFDVYVSASPTDELRIQVIADSSRSEPADTGPEEIDTTATPSGGGAPPDYLGGGGTGGQPGAVGGLDSAGCVLLDPPAELVVEQTGTLQVTNRCDYAIQLASPYLRVASPDITLGAERVWPAALEPGASLLFTVAIAPGSAFVEEIFFVTVSAPDYERHAITLRTPD